MIIVEDVHKRYWTTHGPGRWVLRGVTVTIPTGVSVGLIGRNGAGKSTLLRLIGGVDQPTRGRIQRRCRVSWPMGRATGLPRFLTGRQNSKFLCRVQGYEADMDARIAAIEEFAELGEYFDEPIETYSAGMRSRLQFALSLAFDFDVYIADESIGAGDAVFMKKARAAFSERTGRASLIMASHSDVALKQFCTAGIWLNAGKVHWFDDINDALAAYEQSLPK